MSNSTDFPTIKMGDSGRNVVMLQLMLEDLGCSVGSCGVDGIYGKDTRSAVNAFRASRDLPQEDNVDSATQIRIISAWWEVD